MKCKACNSEMNTYYRKHTDELGVVHRIEEDLCSTCLLHLMFDTGETELSLGINMGESDEEHT